MLHTTERGKWVIGLVLVLGGFCPSWAASFSWTFQRIDPVPAPSGQVALGMRVGETWPTVFYENGPSMLASSLTPAGWSAANLQGQAALPFARTDVAPDGRIGSVWQRSNEIRFTQSSRLGWQTASVATLTSTSSMTAPDVAYLSGNRPVVAYQDGGFVHVLAYDNLVWTGDTIPAATPADSVTLDIDSQDRIGVAYNGNGNVCFALKDSSLGDWIIPTNSVRAGTANQLSLAFGPNDEAGLAMLTSGLLEFAWFDTQAGAWKRDTLASNVTSTRVNLVFNSQGFPALSYVATDGVHYRINDGNGWADAILPVGMDPDSSLDVTAIPVSDAALAFDRDDLPVIAYNSTAGLLLAYDPVVVPEPACVLLLLAGLGLSITRRHAR